MEQKLDEDILKNDKPKKAKYRRISLVFICLEIFIFVFDIDKCACGIPFHNKIISQMIFLIQILLYYISGKFIIKENKNESLLLKINIGLFIIFLIGLILIPNDMDKLHL